MAALFFIMLFVFVGYVGYIWIKYGVQPSISDSYYVLPNVYNSLFTLFCWGFAFPIMILASTPLMFFSGAGICFVGAAAAFRSNLTKEVHIAGALLGVLLSQVSIAIDYKMYYINFIFITTAALIILFKKYLSNTTWWIEIIAFISICYAIGKTLFL